MTDTPLAVPRPTDDAATAAASAARAAGCTVRTIAELADLDAVCRLFAGIWQPGGENPW